MYRDCPPFAEIARSQGGLTGRIVTYPITRNQNSPLQATLHFHMTAQPLELRKAKCSYTQTHGQGTDDILEQRFATSVPLWRASLQLSLIQPVHSLQNVKTVVARDRGITAAPFELEARMNKLRVHWFKTPHRSDSCRYEEVGTWKYSSMKPVTLQLDHQSD